MVEITLDDRISENVKLAASFIQVLATTRNLVYNM